jgi:hypothetical protein
MWSTKHKMQGQKAANKPSRPHHYSKSNMALGKVGMCIVVVGATFFTNLPKLCPYFKKENGLSITTTSKSLMRHHSF